MSHQAKSGTKVALACLGCDQTCHYHDMVMGFTISLSCVWRWSESSNPSIWTRMALVSGRHLGRRCAGSCERCIPRMARFNIGLLEVGLLSPWVRWRWDTAATYTWMVLAWSILLRWVANKMTVCWDPGRGVCPCIWQKERYSGSLPCRWWRLMEPQP